MPEYEQRPKQQQRKNDAPIRQRQPRQPKPKRIGEPYDPWAGNEPKGLAKKQGHEVNRASTSRAAHAYHQNTAEQSGAATRVAIDPSHDFGEHIVGSTSAQTIHMPWNLADQDATAKFRVRGAGFELLSPHGEVSMPPSGSMKAGELVEAEHESPKITRADTKASLPWRSAGPTVTSRRKRSLCMAAHGR